MRVCHQLLLAEPSVPTAVQAEASADGRSAEEPAVGGSGLTDKPADEPLAAAAAAATGGGGGLLEWWPRVAKAYKLARPTAVVQPLLEPGLHLELLRADVLMHERTRGEHPQHSMSLIHFLAACFSFPADSSQSMGIFQLWRRSSTPPSR